MVLICLIIEEEQKQGKQEDMYIDISTCNLFNGAGTQHTNFSNNKLKESNYTI